MTLRSKGSRKITVDGTEYRWSLRNNDDHQTLAVELHRRAQQTMVAKFWSESMLTEFSLTPSMVAE